MSPSARSHAELEELIVVDALDGLDPDGRQELTGRMAEHGPECQECLRLEAEYEEVAGYLATSVEPESLSPGAEEALLRAARQSLPEVLRLEPSPRRRWFAPAAIAAAVAVIAGIIGYALAPVSDARQAQFIAFVSRPGTTLVPFPSQDGQQLGVAFREGEGRGWIFGTNVEEPAGDRVYELWFRSSGSDRMEPAGTFEPEDGVVLTPVTIGESPDLIAVSIEPPGGSPQPTTDPVFVAEV